MPAEPKTIRGMKLPMKCVDCHVTDRDFHHGAILPVTFEQNCKSCHSRELEFDVYQVLGPAAAPRRIPRIQGRSTNSSPPPIAQRWRPTRPGTPPAGQRPDAAPMPRPGWTA